jgi:hypothetical protein
MEITNNIIKINNLKNTSLDFDDKLSSNNSLLIKNCLNIKINIQSKINKITIENSKQVYITVQKLIAGFEIVKSKRVLLSLNNFIELNEDTSNFIPCIDLFKSDLYLVGCIDKYKDIKISSELSNIYHVDI